MLGSIRQDESKIDKDIPHAELLFQVQLSVVSDGYSTAVALDVHKLHVYVYLYIRKLDCKQAQLSASFFFIWTSRSATPKHFPRRNSKSQLVQKQQQR